MVGATINEPVHSVEGNLCECPDCIIDSALLMLKESFNRSAVLDVKREDRCVLCYHAPCSCIKPQSGIEQKALARETLKSQNVRFTDQFSGMMNKVSKGVDQTRNFADTNDTALDNFFSRPIKIQEITWTVGGSIDTFIDPWNLYFTNPRVENRITNFNLMRADLHIKIIINGNGFYFGRALAAYCPFYQEDDLTNTSDLNDLVQWSQMPKVFIDPTTSTGGELVIPFHSERNAIELQTRSWTVLGRMWLRSLNILKHANASTSPVTVQIFAWAENVDLSVLTSVDLSALVPQSGEEIDEANSKGIISGPATTVARIASSLSVIPVIKPYATATAKAAQLTASISSMLGYCKPPITKAPDPYRPTPVSSLALTNVPDVTQKLTVDHKQELTIDPIISGYGDGSDLLSIKSIASRESYFRSFTWPVSASTDSLLCSVRVDPCLWAEVLGGIWMTAPCAAALPFKYWSGTMKFRFQFVCSSFHKGRVRLVYDPNELAVGADEWNVNYMEVVDLAEKHDYTVSLGMGQSTTYREHFLPGTDVDTSIFNTSPLSLNATKGNGVLNMYVVNTLTTPNSVANNDIEVNVFVSAGDDFEVAVPDAYFQNFVVKPQSGLELSSSSQTAVVPETLSAPEQNAPMQEASTNIAVASYAHENTNLVYFGETIKSFRTLLKRYNKWRILGDFTSAAVSVRMQFNAFPFLRGNVSGAVDTRAGPASYNYCNTVMLHWVTLMFNGWRGSIRYKLLPRMDNGNIDTLVSRFPIDSSASGYNHFSSAAPLYSGSHATHESGVYEYGTTAPSFYGKSSSGVNGSTFSSTDRKSVV